MAKKLRFLSGNMLGDPFETSAFSAVAVFRLNGRTPDRTDIGDCLRIAGLEGTAQEVQKVVDLLPEPLKPGAEET